MSLPPSVFRFSPLLGSQVRCDSPIAYPNDLSALELVHPGLGVIHHSDQGIQYASTEYVDELKSHEFKISMARMGNPYENAMAESFFKTLKYEEVYLCDYETMADVTERLI